MAPDPTREKLEPAEGVDAPKDAPKVEPTPGVPDDFSEQVAGAATESDVGATKTGALDLVKAEVGASGENPEQLAKDLEVEKNKGDTKKDDELPDNKYSRALKMLKDEVTANPTLKGPLVNAAMSILALASRYAGFADMLPGGFVARLRTDEDLKDKKFEDDELKKVLRMDKAATAAKEQTIADELAKEKHGTEKASTMYVSQALFGISNIEDASQLAARLLNTKKQTDGKDVSYYKTVGMEDLKRDGMPFGTVLIFARSIRSPEKTVAYATGNGDEFRFYDAEQAKVVTARLKDEKSPIKSSFALQVAFRPKFNSDPDYFIGEKEQQLDSDADETPFGMPRRLKSTAEGAQKLVGSYLLLARKSTVKADAEALAKDALKHLYPCIQTVDPLFEKVLGDAELVKDPEVVKMLDEASKAYASVVADALDYYSKNTTEGNPEKKLTDHAKTASGYRQRVQALLK